MAEEIGGLSLPITADFSGLDADFQAAIQVAVDKGATLREAIISVFKLPDTTTMEAAIAAMGSAVADAAGQLGSMRESMAATGDAAQQAAAQLSLFDDAAHVDFSDVNGQLNLFATELEPLGNAASSAAKGIAEFGSAADLAARPIGSTVVASNELADSANKAADAGKNAGSAWEGFGNTLLGLAGISLTIGALRELVIGSIEVADKIGDAEQSLTRLTGSAAQAKTMMQGLRALADDEGLSFPGLLTAVTRLQVLLPAGADVVGVMRELGNVSELMGTSIEAAGQKFSAIVDATTVSEKTLNKLGLTMGDLTKAMEELGISADKSFNALSHGEKFDVVTTALQKFDGAAKELNDDISGDWTRAMNAARDAMKDLGNAIGDSEHKFSVFSTTVKVVEGVTLSLVAGLKVLIDGVVGGSTIVIEAIKGMATAWGDFAKGMLQAAGGDFKGAFDSFKNAAKDASSAFDNIKAASTFTIDSIKKDWTDGTNALDKAFSTTKAGANDAATGVAHLGDTFDGAAGKAGAAADKTIALAQATHQFVDIAKAAADGMLTFQTATERAWDKVGLLVASQERVNEQLAIAKARFDAGQISAAEYSKAVDLVKKVNDEVAKSLDAVNKIAKEIGEASWARQMNEAAIAAMNLGNDLKALGANAAPIAPAMSEMNRTLSDFKDHATNAGESTKGMVAGIEQLISGLPNLNKALKDGIITQDQYDKDLGLLTKDIQQLAKTDLPLATVEMGKFVQAQINSKAPLGEIQTELASYEGMINKLAQISLPAAIAAQINYIQELNQVPHSLNAIFQAETVLANLEIQNAQERGKNADAWILGLERIKLQQESLRLSTVGLATVTVGLIGDFLKGFDAMSKAVADNIIDGKNWGEVWTGLLKNFAKTVLETVVDGALAALKKSLIDLIIKELPDVASALGIVGGGLVAANVAAGNAAAGMTALATASNAAAASIQASVGAQATAGGQSGSGLAGSISHLADTVNLITGIISAGAAVASTIILSHISSDTGHIEVNTRGQLEEALNLRADLWQQHNTLYDRLGECKNDLDSILDVLRSTTAGPGGLPDVALADLANLPLILAAVQTVNASVINLLSGENMMVLGLQNINSMLFTIHDDLGVEIGKLDTIITSLIYGNNTTAQASRAQMDSFSSFSQSASQIGHGIIGAIDEGTGETARGTDVEIAAAEAARQSAARQYASAASLQQQVTALQAQIAADNQLAAALTRSGNATLAATYTNEANMLSKDVQALLPQLGTMVSSTQNVALMVGQLDLNSGGYIANSTTQIVGAVYGSASMIAAAVGSAIAATGGYATGPATTTHIPPKGTPTNVPTQESQNPGNSNSPTGNTGLPSNPPPQGAGGYVIPLPPPNYGPASQNPYGNYATTNTTVPFNPLNPFTWSSNMSQAQQDAINNAHVPSFDQGGMVPTDMLSMVHKDEMVLPPDISSMLRRMATVPTLPGAMPSYGGAPTVAQGAVGTIINMPFTFNGVTNAKEMMDMWTQRVKLIIPRATVFSGS